MWKPFVEIKRRLVKRRMRARVHLIAWDEGMLLRKFYRSQKTLGRRGNGWLKRMFTRKRRSVERRMLRAIMAGDDGWEKFPPDLRKRLEWELF